MKRITPLDLIAGLLAIGLMLLMGFGNQEVARSAGGVLLVLVGYVVGSKRKPNGHDPQ